MSSASSHPAVYAGLLGADAGLASTAGHAVALGNGFELMRLFMYGCIGVAAVSGVAAVILAATLIFRREKDVDEEVPDLRALGQQRPYNPDALLSYDDESATTLHEPLSSHAPQPATGLSAEATQPKAKASGGARHMKAAPASARKAVVPLPLYKTRFAREDVAQETRADAETIDQSGSHAASDYIDIAENYVRKQTLRERMAARAAGVASVLAERLGHEDMFDDLPVISRADGTVGDVGTSWWENRLGSSVRRTGAIMEDTEPKLGATGGSSLEMASQYAELGATGPNMPSYAQARAQAISRIVAPVDTGLYPEMRDSSELDGDDLWDVALRAMSERIATQSARPVFSDTIGGSDSLDEPEDLDGPTGFIPFKRPSGHPEVVDTASYVDYLIGEEFEQASSEAAKTTSRNYLRLIRGGSQKARPLEIGRQKREYVPKHFAPPREELLAKEA